MTATGGCSSRPRSPNLVTDRFGVVTDANRQAASLLGTVQRYLVGRPLTMFVADEDRAGFRDRLPHLEGPGVSTWELRLQPHRGQPRSVAVAVEALGHRPGAAVELRWVLHEAEPAAGPVSPARSAAPDWDSLAEALHEMIAAAIPLLRADGVGLMLADQQGVLRWVTATNQVRGVLSAPVVLDHQPIGTCNALTTATRHWTEADAGALSSRVLIEQAKGVLMEREGVDAERAFEVLRRRARSSERKLADVARELLARGR